MKYLFILGLLAFVFATDLAGIIDGFLNPVVEDFTLHNDEGVLTLTVTKIKQCEVEQVDWYLYDDTVYGYIKLDIPALKSTIGDTITFDGAELPKLELGEGILVWRTTFPMGVLENTSRIYIKHNCFMERFSFWKEHWYVPWYTITRLI